MQRLLLAILLSLSCSLSASIGYSPDTTVALETGNNTSAASSFRTQSNGNLGASNISKVNVRKLLYPGFSGKVYAHLMPWFGGTNHMNVGYESDSATQVSAQVTDMISRGIDGAIVDWYGPNFSREDGTTRLLKAEAEKRSGFTFAVMEDVGALTACGHRTGCDVTSQMISDLSYAYNTYEGSPAYMRSQGRPVVFFFGVEAYTIDWARVRASVPGNPLLVQRNATAYNNSTFGGGYSWVAPNPSNPSDNGTGYLNYFYPMALAHPSYLTFGTGFKGFNDTLAAWGSKRITNQNCAATYLNTFTQLNKYYSTSRQLGAIQMVTWNDYEEGTELESGVENCVSITASSSGSRLNWTISGSTGTLDHLTVYVSRDGVNLMTVATLAPTQTSYDLASLGLPAGSYTAYVKAVGLPSIRNHMSGGASISLGTSTGKAPLAKVTVTPGTAVAGATVTASTAGSSDPDGTISATTIDFGDGTVMNGPTASHAYASAGSYTVTATVTDNQGLSSQAKATVTMSAPGVTVLTPQAGSAATGSVRVTATAVAATPVIAMAVYVDNQLMDKVYTASVDTTLQMAPGARYLVVQCWDSRGVVYKTALTVTVHAQTSRIGVPELRLRTSQVRVQGE